MFWTFAEIATLVMAMLTAGAIAGIPIGIWIVRLPVPTPPPTDAELARVADDLERAAALVRERAVRRPSLSR